MPRPRTWQLQEAKARLSQVVRSAQTEGPQEISVHGEPAAVVLSTKDFRRLTGLKLSFVDFIRRSPLAGAGLEVERDKSLARPVDL